MTWNFRNLMTRLINLTGGVIALLLGLRIVFQLISANTTAPIVQWIFATSDNLVYPFQGIFPNLVLSQSSMLNIAALIALVAYGIILYFIAAVIDAIFRPKYTSDVYHESSHAHI